MKKATLTLLMSVTFLYFACANEQSMETNVTEIWKDIASFEGVYQVSNVGRVKSLPRRVKSPIRNNPYIIRKERILKLGTNELGYKRVRLQIGDRDEQWIVHRIVAIAFIPNPENYPIINHIDSNPSNNHFLNLEWCTQSHNIKHAFRMGRKKAPDFFFKPEYGRNNPASKQVRQLSLSGEFIKEWDCVSYIQRDLGFCRPNICAVCKGKALTAYGYKWEYA